MDDFGYPYFRKPAEYMSGSWIQNSALFGWTYRTDALHLAAFKCIGSLQARQTTRIIQSTDDLEGFEAIRREALMGRHQCDFHLVWVRLCLGLCMNS